MASGAAKDVANNYLTVASSNTAIEQEESAPLLDAAVGDHQRVDLGDEHVDLGSPIDEFTDAQLIECSQL